MTVPSPPAGSTGSLREIPLRTSLGNAGKQLQGQEGSEDIPEFVETSLYVSDCCRRVLSTAHPPQKHFLLRL